MKLIQYVIETDKKNESISRLAKYHDMSVEEYILDGHCPSAFDVLENTLYEKPYAPEKKNKAYCKYSDGENESKCIECWNREVPVMNNK